MGGDLFVRQKDQADPNANFFITYTENVKKCVCSGSIRGPFACEANVITNYTTEAFIELV